MIHCLVYSSLGAASKAEDLRCVMQVLPRNYSAPYHKPYLRVCNFNIRNPQINSKARAECVINPVN